MAALIPKITNAGIQAVFDALQNNEQGVISHIAVGDGAYTPSVTQTALQNEIARIPVANGNVIDGRTLHLTGIFEGETSFWVKEIGFFLSDGTLFAVYSMANSAIAYKTAGTDLLLAFDLTLNGVPDGSVTIMDATQDINLSIAPEILNMAIASVQTMHRQIKLFNKINSLSQNTGASL
jgi:Phage tail-collar fibre protein